MRKAVRDPFVVGGIAHLEIAMTKDSKDTGKTSTTKHSNWPPEEIQYFEPSHPIFSGEIEVRFGKNSRASTGGSEGSSSESRKKQPQREPSKILGLMSQLFGKE